MDTLARWYGWLIAHGLCLCGHGLPSWASRLCGKLDEALLW
jgi:hypothetical protein